MNRASETISLIAVSSVPTTTSSRFSYLYQSPALTKHLDLESYDARSKSEKAPKSVKKCPEVLLSQVINLWHLY